MRYAAALAAFVVLGCGPDPNAMLPGMGPTVKPEGAGGNGSGGAPGSGGLGSGGKTTTPVGTGGVVASSGAGGSSPLGSGGVTGTGGRGATTTAGTGGRVGTGGASGRGGASSAGGTVGTGGGTTVGSGGRIGGTGGRVGSGGTTGTGQGGRDGGADAAGGSGGRGIDAGGGTEPCTPSATISMTTGSGGTGNFGTTGEFCFRTPDNIAGWNCSNLDGRTIKVNGTTEACSALPLPAKVNGYYYFDVSAGTYDYASIQWW